jgi:hypothetical protein
MRRLATVVLTPAMSCLLAIPLGGTALAGSSTGPDNLVRVVNDDGTELHGEVQIAFFGGKELRSANEATAVSQNCTGCHTRAVAVQEIILTSTPSTFAPTNTAIAVNYQCTACVTYAYAYQNVISSTPGARLSSSGRRQAAALEDQIEATARDRSINDQPYVGSDGLIHNDLTAALDSLRTRLDSVIRQGLAGSGCGAKERRQNRDAEAA